MSAPTNGTNGNGVPPGPAPAGPGPAGAPGPAMTEDEIALYDRQIRLWGMRAQEKIRSAHVLLVTMRALGNEIAKNLVLAGVGSLTIADHETVTEADLGAQFLLAPPAAEPPVAPDATAAARQAAADRAAAAVVGTNRAVAASQQLRALNPRVRVRVEPSDVCTKPPSFYQPFSLVVVTDRDPAALNFINTASRLVGRPFYAANAYGYYGFLFADLIEHDFVIVRDRGNVVTERGARETRTRTVVDVQLQAAEGGGSGGSGGSGGGGGSGPEKEIVTKRELFSTWFLASDASPLPAAIRSSPRRLRAVSPYLPCLRALWAFQESRATEGNRLPDLQSPADLRAFTRLVSEKQSLLGTPEVKPNQIRSFLQGIALREISPVVTVLGGQLAQDVINTLGHTQQPIQNLLVFDGASFQSSVYALHPDGNLGRRQLATAPGATAATEAATPETGPAAAAGAAGAGAAVAPPAAAAAAAAGLQPAGVPEAQQPGQPPSILTLASHAAPPS